MDCKTPNKPSVQNFLLYQIDAAETENKSRRQKRGVERAQVQEMDGEHHRIDLQAQI